MSELNKTLRLSAIYAAGNLLGRAISIVMLPIYTRCLSSSDYGVLELLTTTADIFGLMVGFGISTAVFRFYYIAHSEQNKVVATAIILLCGLYAIAGGLGCSLSEPLANLVLRGASNATRYFQLLFIGFFFQAFVEIPLVFMRIQQRPYLFVVVSVGRLILQLSMNILFVVYLELGILGVLYSSLAASVLSGTVLVVYTFRETGFGFSGRLARSMMKFGLPFVLAGVGDFVLTFSDRYFLKAYGSLSEVGTYSLGYKLGFILWLFPISAILNVWDAQRYSIAESPQVQDINKKVFLFLNLSTVSCALCISLFSHDFFRIMSASDFWDAYKVVPLIMLAYIVQTWTAFGNFGVIYRGRTKYVAIGTILAAIGAIGANFIFIPRLGSYGAALATLVGFSVRFFFIYWHSQRCFRLNLPWTKCIAILICASVVYCVSLVVDPGNMLVSISFKAFLFAMFVGLLATLPILEKRERQAVIYLVCHPVSGLKW